MLVADGQTLVEQFRFLTTWTSEFFDPHHHGSGRGHTCTFWNI